MQRFEFLTFARSLRKTAITALLLFFASGCTSDKPSQQGAAGSSGSASGGSGGTSSGVTIVPNETGWVALTDEGNTVGVQGAWYPYGDQYGVAKCTNVGMHAPEECSTITSPNPLLTGFPNEEGVMCTTGETAVVLPCGADIPLCTPGTPDYSNMWGAGIGLDLNAEGATDAGPGAKHPWNPEDHDVVGIAFDINTVPPPGLRVEFPMLLPDDTTTEDHLDGSPYWDANPNYTASPVEPGRNEFRWADVSAPRTNYGFDKTKILAIQFHVPAITSGTTRGAYDFCISNLTFLIE